MTQKPDHDSSDRTLLTVDETVALLRALCVPRTSTTLRKLRCLGGGPPFVKVGNRAMYHADDVIAWADSLTSPKVASTTALPPRWQYNRDPCPSKAEVKNAPALAFEAGSKA